MAVKDAIPTIPAVPTGLDRNLTQFLHLLREAVTVRFGQTKNDLDRSPTIRELVNSDVVEYSGNNFSGSIRLSGSGIDLAAPNPLRQNTVPPAPVNLQVASTPDANILTWNPPGVLYDQIISFTEIWAHTADVRASASLVGIGNGTFVHTLEPEDSRYYWVRFVSYSGIAGPYNAVPGTFGQLSPYTGADWLDGLITRQQLATDMNNFVEATTPASTGMNVGALGDYTFADDGGGEVLITGSRLFLPDRTEVVQATFTLFNVFEGTTLGEFYVVCGATDANVRFNGNFQAYKFFIATYDFENRQWKAHHNTDSVGLNFTPAANDCIVAAGVNYSGTANAFDNISGFASNFKIDASNVSTWLGTTAISDAYIANLNAGKLDAGEILADRFAAASITADKLNVTDLASINANLGTLTSGTINASVVTVSNIDATNITTGSLTTDRLNIDGLTLTNVGGNLTVGTDWAASTRGPNLIPDPNFQLTLDNGFGTDKAWSRSDATNILVEASGENSDAVIKFNSAVSSLDCSSETLIPVTPGETIYWAWRFSEEVGYTGELRFAIRLYDINKSFLSAVMIDDSNSGVAGSWQTETGTYAVTTSTHFIRIVLEQRNAGGTNFARCAWMWFGRSEYLSTAGADWVTNLVNIPNNIVEVYYQATEPVSGNVGDIWIDSDDPQSGGSLLYRYDGFNWVIAPVDGQALLDAAGAQGTANNKVYIFSQPTQPVNGDHPEGILEIGDLWIDTNDGNKLWRWDGTWTEYKLDYSTLTDGSGIQPENNATVGATWDTGGGGNITNQPIDADIFNSFVEYAEINNNPIRPIAGANVNNWNTYVTIPTNGYNFGIKIDRDNNYIWFDLRGNTTTGNAGPVKFEIEVFDATVTAWTPFNLEAGEDATDKGGALDFAGVDAGTNQYGTNGIIIDSTGWSVSSGSNTDEGRLTLSKLDETVEFRLRIHSAPHNNSADEFRLSLGDTITIAAGLENVTPIEFFFGARDSAQYDALLLTNAPADPGATAGAIWDVNLDQRPAELIDGRVAAGLDASGDLNRNITVTRANNSDLLRYSSGALYTGDLAATLGATWNTDITNQPDIIGSNLIPDPNFTYAAGLADGGPHWGNESSSITFETTGGEGSPSGPVLQFLPPPSQQGVAIDGGYIPTRKDERFYGRIRYKASSDWNATGTAWRFEIGEFREDFNSSLSWPNMIIADDLVKDNTWRWATGSAVVASDNTYWMRPDFQSLTWTVGSIVVSHVEVYRFEPDATVGAQAGTNLLNANGGLLADIDIRNDLLVTDALAAMNHNPSMIIPADRNGTLGPSGYIMESGLWPTYADPATRDYATKSGGAYPLIMQAMPVNPDARYEISAYVAMSATTNVDLAVNEYDTAAMPVDRYYVSNADNATTKAVLRNRSVVVVDNQSIGTGFTIITGSYVPTPTAKWFSPYIWGNGSTNDWDVDWFVVREQTTRNKITTGSGAPGGGSEGDLYFDTTNGEWWSYLPGGWSIVSDLTASHEAATIVNQGALATQNTADYTSDVSGTKPPTDATRNQITSGTADPTGGVDGDLYYETDWQGWWANVGGTWYKVSDITAANQAATIAGQGSLATQNTADFVTDVSGNEKPQNYASATAPGLSDKVYNAWMSIQDVERDRPSGWFIGDTLTATEVQYQDAAKTIMLLGDTDDNVSCCSTAFSVNPNEPVRISIRLRGSVSSATGLYLRVHESTSDLTEGKLWLSRPVTVDSPTFDNQYRQAADDEAYASTTSGGLNNTDKRIVHVSGPAFPWENDAVPNTWTEYVMDYTPPSNVKWASVAILNWTGFPAASGELWVDRVSVASIPADNTGNLVIKINTSATGASNPGEIALVPKTTTNALNYTTDGYIYWEGTRYTVPRDAGDGHTIVAGAADSDNKHMLIVHDLSLSNPFTANGQVRSTVLGMKGAAGQWKYDNNTALTNFTVTTNMVALGWVLRGTGDNITAGGLFSQPIKLEAAILGTEDLEIHSASEIEVKDIGVRTLANTGATNTLGTTPVIATNGGDLVVMCSAEFYNPISPTNHNGAAEFDLYVDTGAGFTLANRVHVGTATSNQDTFGYQSVCQVEGFKDIDFDSFRAQWRARSYDIGDGTRTINLSDCFITVFVGRR